MASVLEMLYRNWRGEVSRRRIGPVTLWFGATSWHPERQWMMTAYDLDKAEHRDFALKDCIFASSEAVEATRIRRRENGEWVLDLSNGTYLSGLLSIDPMEASRSLFRMEPATATFTCYISEDLKIDEPPKRDPVETQESIGRWADKTFGEVTDFYRAVERAQEEMDEIFEAFHISDIAERDQELVEEAADVVIVLRRLAHTLGQDLEAAISRKMAKNRGRMWVADGTGHGYHVKREPATDQDEWPPADSWTEQDFRPTDAIPTLLKAREAHWRRRGAESPGEAWEMQERECAEKWGLL